MARIHQGQDNVDAWRTIDSQLKQRTLIRKEQWSKASRSIKQDSRDIKISKEYCVKWNTDTDCDSKCEYIHTCDRCQSTEHDMKNCRRSHLSSSNFTSLSNSRRWLFDLFAIIASTISMTLQSVSEIFLYNITLANELLLDDKDFLKANMWEKHLTKHSNRKFAFTLIKTFIHDAKIEYIDSNILFLTFNHFFTFFAFNIFTVNLYKQMKTYRITRVQRTFIKYFISSSLDLVSKAIDD